MKKLFKKRERQKHQGMLKPFEIDFDRIDNYVLGKYGLKDIKNKNHFVLLNLLFMAVGMISTVTFIYDGINAVALGGSIITLITGFAIFTSIKKHGVKIEEKNEKEKKEK